MTVAVFVAVLTHLVVVLGVSFDDQPNPIPAANTLDITLVQPTKEAEQPDDAKALANQNQEGGGESEQKERTTTQSAATVRAPSEQNAAGRYVPPRPPPAAARQTLPGPEAKVANQTLLTSNSNTENVVSATRPKPRSKPQRLVREEPRQSTATPLIQTPVRSAAALVNAGLAFASLPAELDRRLAAYSSNPRVKQLNSRTREYRYAAYMEAWRTKVERLGKLNYPDEARRRRLSGKLTLNVAIKPDGSVERIIVSKSSGQKVLDDAAVRIVKLAAPFAPFPDTFRDEVDVLDIHRTWRFLSSGKLASN
jgi:periplasmic protein TonB